MRIEKYLPKDFELLEKVWKQLQSGKDMSVYQTYEWNRILNNQYLNTSKYNRLVQKYEYYIVYKDEKPKVILPLMIQKIDLTLCGHGIKKGVYIIGSRNYSDYLNWIYGELDEEIFNYIIRWLKNKFVNHNILFLCIKDETQLNNRLMSESNVRLDKDTIAVYVENEYNQEVYNKKLSKSTRQNLRTALNRMNKNNINYEIKEFSKINNRDLINTLVNLHIKRYVQKNSNNNKIINFIKKLKETRLELKNNVISQSMKSLDNSWLLVIYLNNEIVGFLYGLRWKNEINIMQNCVDTEYNFYSPTFRGIYDYIISLNESMDSKIDKIDFTRGSEEYKYKLNGKESILHNFYISKGGE